MDADKPVLVVNLPPVRFIGDPTKQGITGNIQGAWDLERLVAVLTTVSVPVEEALSGIDMNARRVLIHLECNSEEGWIKSLEE